MPIIAVAWPSNQAIATSSRCDFIRARRLPNAESKFTLSYWSDYVRHIFPRRCQKGDTNQARSYLQRAINEYHSTGAQKVLKIADEYDAREKALKQKGIFERYGVANILL